MSFLSDIRERFRAVFFRARQEREMAEELRFHVERETAERIRNGVEPGAARREALLAFGGVEQQKEAVRDARGIRLFDELGADLRFALRGLRRNPGFTATAILVLGLGLGATTAVVCVMRAVVLAELPYPDPDRLVMVLERNAPTNTWNISTADAIGIREQQRSFEAWGAISRNQVALSGAGGPETIVLGLGSAGFFQAVGVAAVSGRLIDPRDEEAGAAPVLLVSDALAERRLGGAGQAIGRSLTLDGISYEVVGVLPKGRNDLGGLTAAAWSALKLPVPTRRGPFWLRSIGRLKSGVTVDMAAADLAAISARILPLWTDFPDSLAKLTPIPLHDLVVGGAGRQVGLFAGAVLLVLLLSITNVATLVLVRASAREPEVAVRMMLGAGRGRITRLLLTENLLLTLASALAGLLLAVLGLKLAIAIMPNLPRIGTAVLDWRAVVFAISAAIVSGILVSLSPVAALSSRARGALRTDTRRTGTGRRTNAIRSALVVTEFALALPLLAAAGLLLNSFVRLARVDPGFNPEGLVAVTITLPTGRYPENPERQLFWQRADQRMAELPGAAGFGLTSGLPPDNSGANDNFNLVDHPVSAGQTEPTSPWYYVTSGYFAALGIPVLDGRVFTAADSGTGPPVVVVSRAWANKYFPREQAVGRQLIQGGCYDCPRTTIVGVVGDIKNLGLAVEDEAVYGPVTQTDPRSMSLVLRAGGGTAAAIRSLRNVVSSLDNELPMVEATIAGLYSDSLGDPRRWTGMLGGFAAAGLILAAVGIFGLMSYVVRQRRREIGVRLALGAQPGSVIRLIVGKGMRYAGIGSAIGLVATVLLTRRLSAQLFEVSPTDGLTIAAVAAVLLAVALIACWLPGRRAARIKPLEAISSE